MSGMINKRSVSLLLFLRVTNRPNWELLIGEEFYKMGTVRTGSGRAAIKAI